MVILNNKVDKVENEEENKEESKFPGSGRVLGDDNNDF